jgi:hypothetical protein
MSYRHDYPIPRPAQARGSRFPLIGTVIPTQATAWSNRRTIDLDYIDLTLIRRPVESSCSINIVRNLFGWLEHEIGLVVHGANDPAASKELILKILATLQHASPVTSAFIIDNHPVVKTFSIAASLACSPA